MPRYALETLVFLLAILWLFGWLVWPFAGGFIHVLLVLILAVVALRIVQWRKPVA